MITPFSPPSRATNGSGAILDLSDQLVQLSWWQLLDGGFNLRHRAHSSVTRIRTGVAPTRDRMCGLAKCPSGLKSWTPFLFIKDIKPANVLVDSATAAIWLTGFGIASRLPRERQSPEPPDVIAGTLAYMAPEQTGRMNRSID